MEMSPNKTFNDYIFKDILNTIGPAVMGVKEDEEDLREVNNKRILRVELESSGTMLLELLDGLQNLDHNIKVRGKQEIFIGTGSSFQINSMTFLNDLQGVTLDPRDREKIIQDIESLLKSFQADQPEGIESTETLGKMEVWGLLSET